MMKRNPLQLSTPEFFELVRQIFPTILLPVRLSLKREMGRLCCLAFSNAWNHPLSAVRYHDIIVI